MTDKPRHYLDSGVFQGFLNGEAEPANFEACHAVIKAAEDGLIDAFTSAFTMGEVVYIKAAPGKDALPVEEQEEIIASLMDAYWLERASFEPDMAEINRYLLRQYGGGKSKLQPYDSVHVATAMRLKVNYFDTLDDRLINLLPPQVSYPPRYPDPVIIQRPFVDRQQLELPGV